MKIDSLAKLHTELNKIAPSRYSHFGKKQALPFITYIDDGEENFHADNYDYLTGEFVRIELNTLNKDLVRENQLKQLFRDAGIGFDKMPTDYIESEEMYMTAFEIKLRY